MAEHWMEILRPGEWNGHDFTASYIRDLQASYDPAEIEAPVVVGHPGPFGDEQPAYGWIKALEIRPQADAETDDDISLWALTDLNEEAEAMIRDRKFPKRSVGVLDQKGIPYLRHVALLGASNPAVSSLEDVELKESFTADDGALVTLSINDKMIELIWESKDKEYWYRVRPPTRFKDDTMRSFDIKGIDGLRAVGGKLKEQYVPEGGKADSMVIQALRFDKKQFDLGAAKRWVTSHKKELSRMSEGTITLTEDEQIIQLKAEKANLEAKNAQMVEDAEAHKAAAKKAKDELEVIRLATLEGVYEHKLNALIDDGNGVPAYIELGVHKALVAVDGVDVTLAEGKTMKASEIFLTVLSEMPKVIESKEIAGTGGGKETKLSDEIPTDNRFVNGMSTYAEEGHKVINLDLVELANKIEKEEKCTPQEATLKALTLSAQGGK